MANKYFDKLNNSVSKSRYVKRSVKGSGVYYKRYQNDKKHVILEHWHTGKKDNSYYLVDISDPNNAVKSQLNRRQYKSLVRNEVYSSRLYFIPRLILLIIFVNLIAVGQYSIDRKKYIPALDNSVVYYDYNYTNGVITQLNDVDNINVYTDEEGHIIQSVYNYDWLNKFQKLKALKPVFAFEKLPSDDSFKSYIDDLDVLKGSIKGSNEFIYLGSQYIDRVKLLLNYGLIEFYYDNDGYYLRSISALSDDDVKQVNYVNALIKKVNITNWEDYLAIISNIFAYPISIFYNFCYDFIVIADFIFTW